MSKYNFVRLQDLEVYQLARDLSRAAWPIYEDLYWQDKKIMGDQFIEAIPWVQISRKVIEDIIIWTKSSFIISAVVL